MLLGEFSNDMKATRENQNMYLAGADFHDCGNGFGVLFTNLYYGLIIKIKIYPSNQIPIK